MSTEDPEFLSYIRGVFNTNNCDFDEINTKIHDSFPDNVEEREKLAISSHFYYYICTPHKNIKDGPREELQIVGMTSLIESLMNENKYLDAFEYFNNEYPKQNEIKDFKKFRNDYLIKYGCTNKIVKYFNEYFDKNEVNDILSKIEIWSTQNNRHSKLDSIESLAKLLYQMRSDFVHNADMRGFCPEHCESALVYVGKKYYSIRGVNIKTILNIFEKSFVRYWKIKVIKYNLSDKNPSKSEGF